MSGSLKVPPDRRFERQHLARASSSGTAGSMLFPAGVVPSPTVSSGLRESPASGVFGARESDGIGRTGRCFLDTWNPPDVMTLGKIGAGVRWLPCLRARMCAFRAGDQAAPSMGTAHDSGRLRRGSGDSRPASSPTSSETASTSRPGCASSPRNSAWRSARPGLLLALELRHEVVPKSSKRLARRLLINAPRPRPTLHAALNVTRMNRSDAWNPARAISISNRRSGIYRKFSKANPPLTVQLSVITVTM